MIPIPEPQKFVSKLASIEKISSKVYLERFELIEPKEISFIPGQTVMLYVAPGVNRTMSIASPPSEKKSITLFHDVSPMGPYSKWALSAKVGDPMEFMGPLGVFIMDRESRRNKVLIATGTGMTPFYVMVRDYLSSGGAADVRLYWGLRHEEDIFWQNQFEELSKQYPNFHFLLTLSQGTEGWQGKKGHVQDYLFSQQNLRDAEYYICGNKLMVEDVRAKLKDLGVPDTQVKFELFY
jgi:CDP-4-dehydro-6-deoxyglucose reductase